MKKEDSDQQVNQQNRNNPIKRAEKEKQFRTVGQLKDIITDPQVMYETVQKYKNTFKNVPRKHPKIKNTEIIDFSLNARGPQEDQIYVKQPFYRYNIRRGNTLIYDNKEKKATWARKGLMKFFDISQKSLKAIAQEDIVSLDKRDKYNYYAVFSQVQNVLSCNDELEQKDKAKVHVYRLNKANGENAQVSYCKQSDQWVISSKNVSVLAQTVVDLKYYDEERYQFAKLIAQTWFKLISNKNKEQLQKLKNDLNGKTIVGQYCGNPQFQHLVKYAHVTIFFYATVQTAGKETCILPSQTFRLLQENGLPIVKNYEKSLYGKYSSYTELGKALTILFSEVASSSIFEQEQGSVIYLVIEKPKVFCEFVSDRYLQATVPIPQNWEQKEVWLHVSALGKLKTLEYRLLRKLRQKLRYFSRMKKQGGNQQKNAADAKKFEEKYGSFEKESYQLLTGQKLSKPIEYYFCIALIAFDYVFKNRKSHKNLELLDDHYLDFLSVIFWCVQNKKEVTPALMADWQLHEQLRGQTWQDYSIQIIQSYEQLLSKFAPKYAKVKKSMKIGQEKQESEQEEGQKMQEKQQEQV